MYFFMYVVLDVVLHLCLSFVISSFRYLWVSCFIYVFMSLVRF